MADLNHPDFFDCASNIEVAIAAIEAVAVQLDSDVVLSLKHSAEGLRPHVDAAMGDETGNAKNDAWVRIGCLVELIEEVNGSIDQQLLYGAVVLLRLAKEQLMAPEPA